MVVVVEAVKALMRVEDSANVGNDVEIVVEALMRIIVAWMNMKGYMSGKWK